MWFRKQKIKEKEKKIQKLKGPNYNFVVVFAAVVAAAVIAWVTCQELLLTLNSEINTSKAPIKASGWIALGSKPRLEPCKANILPSVLSLCTPKHNFGTIKMWLIGQLQRLILLLKERQAKSLKLHGYTSLAVIVVGCLGCGASPPQGRGLSSCTHTQISHANDLISLLCH